MEGDREFTVKRVNRLGPVIKNMLSSVVICVWTDIKVEMLTVYEVEMQNLQSPIPCNYHKRCLEHLIYDSCLPYDSLREARIRLATCIR